MSFTNRLENMLLCVLRWHDRRDHGHAKDTRMEGYGGVCDPELVMLRVVCKDLGSRSSLACPFFIVAACHGASEYGSLAAE